MNKEDKKCVVNKCLRNVSHIENKEYQKRIWTLGEGPEVNDFDETCCHFFHMGDDVIERYRYYGLTERQRLILKKFRDEFEIFSEENDWPPDFIDTPEWTRITEMAKEVLEAFNYKPEAD